jgi:hypothetical protein
MERGEFAWLVIWPKEVGLVRLPPDELGWKWFNTLVKVKKNWAPTFSL